MPAGTASCSPLKLQYLDSLELDFDLTITGFETVDIDLLIQGDDEVDAAADEIPEPLRR